MVAQVVRSIVMPNGIVTAHADSRLISKPVNGGEKVVKLPRRVTVMMGFQDSEGNISRLIVGDHSGAVRTISYPEMKLEQSFQLTGSRVTALSVHEASGKKMVIAGLDNGEIHAIDESLPKGSIKLLKLDGSIGLINSNEEILTIHSGWVRDVRQWDGDAMSPARRWFEPPIPPNRRKSTQLTLQTAAPA